MAGETDPVSYIFGGNTGLTYEQLKRRRAVALALASQRRGYPKTVGEGMTYLGESIGDMLAERRLDAAEKGYLAKQGQTLAGLMPGAPSAAPVSAPARPGAAPTTIAPRPAPPPPVRPPPAPVPPRPQVSMVPVRPTPSDPYGATEGTGEGFAPGGILNPTPMTADLTPPPGMRGDLYPSEGTPPSLLSPSTAAAPPVTAPTPTAAPPVSAMDFASWPQGPIRRPTDTAMEPGVATPPVAPPAAPATPAASLGPQSDLTGFIAKQEGFRPTAYSDYKQTSIGYGTRGTPGETITREEAQRRLESEVAKARGYVEAFAPEAPPGVKDALTSLTYNAGPGWQQAGLGRLIKEGRYDEARDRFTQYNKAGGSTLPGLVSRRNAEISQLWDQAGAPAAPPDERLALERPLPQRGGEGMTLASYGSPNMRSDAPPPGIGSAGGNIRFQSDPFQPPAGAAPAAPDEQVTPTNIEPMPATAQLQAGQLGQFGPPTGRFSEAPMPGVAAAPPSPQAPAVTASPPQPQGPLPGAIPGPLAQPTPVSSPPSLGRQTVPVPAEFNRPLVRPTPPTYPEQPSEYEIRAQRAIAANPGDPTIHEQAKALADFGKAQRDAAYMRQVEEYKKDLDLYNSLATSREQFIRTTPERELTLRKGEEELASKARAEERERRLGGVAPEVLTKQIEESQKNVKNIPAATLAIANANRALLEQNMFTGSSAEMNLSMAKLLKAAGFPGDPRIEATEQFRAYISPIVAQARQAMAGGTNISDRDMMAAERAAAGDIKLERGSIKSVLDSVERINTAMAVDHQKKLLTFAGNDPDAQRVIFGTFGLPMENIVPPAAVQRLRDNASNPQAIREFDDAFKTPGLAQRVLGRR